MTEIAIPDNIFRAYDIRGIVGEGLCVETMRLIGRAVGSEALDQGERSLIVAADARLSSPAFRDAMIDGILATGCDVLDIGTVPTPMLYFATHHLEPDSGVMITGSHNPGHYNGVKLVLRHHCLADTQILALQKRIGQGEFRQGTGHRQQTDIREAYMARITGDIHLQRPPRVVIDAGNGVTGLVAPALFEALGCEVECLFCEPDGHFPNHHPDPTVADNLQDLIRHMAGSQADLGIAFDGDGDRVGLVTANGQIIDADRMMMCFISDILPQCPGETVVFDVKSSYLLTMLVEAHGGKALLCKSGHSFVKQRMLETHAILGGEYSAHIFFRHRWYGFDDGLYCAARFLELMDRYNASADALLARMPPSFGTPELSIDIDEKDRSELMASIRASLRLPGANLNYLDGIRADYTDGWGLIRASNTMPRLVCRFEASSQEALDRIRQTFREELSPLLPGLNLPF